MSKEFGSRVRQARKNAGMTQAELAEKMNLDTTTISRIENGNLSTSFSSMLNFSKVLNVRFEYLICDYLEEKPSISDPLELEILDLFCLCVVDESASLCIGASNIASVSRDGDTPHQRIVLVRNVR